MQVQELDLELVALAVLLYPHLQSLLLLVLLLLEAAVVVASLQRIPRGKWKVVTLLSLVASHAAPLPTSLSSFVIHVTTLCVLLSLVRPVAEALERQVQALAQSPRLELEQKPQVPPPPPPPSLAPVDA